MVVVVLAQLFCHYCYVDQIALKVHVALHYIDQI